MNGNIIARYLMTIYTSFYIIIEVYIRVYPRIQTRKTTYKGVEHFDNSFVTSYFNISDAYLLRDYFFLSTENNETINRRRIPCWLSQGAID